MVALLSCSVHLGEEKLSSGALRHITISTLSGEQHHVQLRPDATLVDLQSCVTSVLGMPADLQKIVSNDHVLTHTDLPMALSHVTAAADVTAIADGMSLVMSRHIFSGIRGSTLTRHGKVLWTKVSHQPQPDGHKDDHVATLSQDRTTLTVTTYYKSGGPATVEILDTRELIRKAFSK